MGMGTCRAEAVTLAIENLLPRGGHTASNLALCIILGVERSSPLLFESHLPELLRQVQMAAFSSEDKSVPQEALIRALKIYSPSEKASSCQLILHATHALLVASMQLCRCPPTGDVREFTDEEGRGKAEMGVFWTCFLIEHMPMTLRTDLAHRYPSTIRSLPIFTLLLPLSPHLPPPCQAALCSALPLLATWDTAQFVESPLFERTVGFMSGMAMDSSESLGEGEGEIDAMNGLGQLATIVLDRFEPFIQDIGHIALHALSHAKSGAKPKTQRAAQHLLARLLASQGPTTLHIMVEYLHSPHHVLLDDVELLEMIATLLPNLAKRIVQTLTDIIDALLHDGEEKKKGDDDSGGKGDREYRRESVLEALNVFPLRDIDLATRAQKLVLESLEEDNGKQVVIAALQLATNPIVATPCIMRNLTFKIAQLLLADDLSIVHTALSVLSNPTLASMLDERSCSMILLALHQSLEPSVQIIAAKLLAHLTTAHRAIVQPLAWSHIRQSLRLIDFLESVDPIKAVIEACIISNLLPALPPSLHKKYVAPVKDLIMTGLRRPCEPHVLSLIFQGLSNLARFEGYSSLQQSQLVQDLLEMTHEIPKECQHAALNAISSLLSVPKDGLDVYELLVKVHANFGGGRGKGLDNDLKALVSGIYGHLGTVERNPVISRDSKAAINREMLNYPSRTTHASRISEIRDRYGALHPTTINTLLAENLLMALSTSLKATDDRSLVLETMSCLGILQPRAIPSLIPDLPDLIMSELKYALKSRDSARDANSTNVSAGLLFLSSTMHTSGVWMERYWGDMEELMGECVKNGEALPVLRGLDLVLAAIND